MSRKLLIDSHVHIYKHFNLQRFLDGAHSRLSAAASDPDTHLVLALTETAHDDAFARLASGTLTAKGWTVDGFADDPTALRVSDDAGRALLLIAGRQIVTAERIEILALGTLQQYADGQMADDVLKRLSGSETPAILPWGLGKWTGVRGKLMRKLLKAYANQKGVALGDNAGRPVGWPQPTLFRDAATLGVPILPGSDPLPVVGAESDVGGYCFGVTADIDLDRPGAALMQTLFNMRGQPRIHGGRKSVLGVARDQIALRQNRQN